MQRQQLRLHRHLRLWLYLLLQLQFQRQEEKVKSIMPFSIIYLFYNVAAVVAMSPPPLSTPVVPLPPSPGSIADGKGFIVFFIIPKSIFIISLI
jgi:hypothetical protein